MDKRQDREKKLWQKLAKNYDKQVKTYDEAYRLTIQKSLNHINPNSVVLDFACGTGIVSLGIADASKKVIAVDISDKMIDIANEKRSKNKVNNIEFETLDGYKLAYPDQYFDVILLYNVLHVVEEPQTVLKETKRILKHDGVILSATDCYREPASLGIRIRLFVLKLIRKLGLIPILSYFKKKELEQLFIDENFEIIEKDDLHKNPVNYYIAVKNKIVKPK